MYSVKHVELENGRVLLRTMVGEFRMKDIIQAWADDIESGLVNDTLSAVITDFSNATNIAKIEEMSDIAAFYRAHANIFGKLKNAVVLNSPNVAIALLYEQENPSFQHKAFSAVDAALFWIRE